MADEGLVPQTCKSYLHAAAVMAFMCYLTSAKHSKVPLEYGMYTGNIMFQVKVY